MNVSKRTAGWNQQEAVETPLAIMRAAAAASDVSPTKPGIVLPGEELTWSPPACGSGRRSAAAPRGDAASSSGACARNHAEQPAADAAATTLCASSSAAAWSKKHRPHGMTK